MAWRIKKKRWKKRLWLRSLSNFVARTEDLHGFALFTSIYQYQVPLHLQFKVLEAVLWSLTNHQAMQCQSSNQRWFLATRGLKNLPKLSKERWIYFNQLHSIYHCKDHVCFSKNSNHLDAKALKKIEAKRIHLVSWWTNSWSATSNLLISTVAPKPFEGGTSKWIEVLQFCKSSSRCLRPGSEKNIWTNKWWEICCLKKIFDHQSSNWRCLQSSKKGP